MDSIKDALKKLSFFEGLTDQELDQIAKITERRSFGPGTSIFQEGEADVSIFFVEGGTVNIEKQVNFDQEQTLQRLQPGDFFGEISFVLGGSHIASAKAVKESSILLIRRTEFDRLASRTPSLGYKIMLRMSMQLATLLRTMDERFVELVGYIWGRSKK